MVGIEYFLLGYFVLTPEKARIPEIYSLLLSHGIGARGAKNGKLFVREKHRKKLMKI